MCMVGLTGAMFQCNEFGDFSRWHRGLVVRGIFTVEDTDRSPKRPRIEIRSAKGSSHRDGHIDGDSARGGSSRGGSNRGSDIHKVIPA